MGTQVLYTLEITFWKAVIPLMRESGFVQTLVRGILPLVQHIVLENVIFERKELRRLALHALVLAAAGLVIGFAAGLILLARGIS